MAGGWGGGRARKVFALRLNNFRDSLESNDFLNLEIFGM